MALCFQYFIKCQKTFLSGIAVNGDFSQHEFSWSARPSKEELLSEKAATSICLRVPILFHLSSDRFLGNTQYDRPSPPCTVYRTEAYGVWQTFRTTKYSIE